MISLAGKTALSENANAVNYSRALLTQDFSRELAHSHYDIFEVDSRGFGLYQDLAWAKGTQGWSLSCADFELVNTR